MNASARSAPRRRIAIGVMAKAPVPGLAKTRLIPLLGADGAARLQARLLDRTLALCVQVAPRGVTLFTQGDGGMPDWAAYQKRYAVPLALQQGPDLGARMHRALSSLLQQADIALLVGTDCPALQARHLRAATRALRTAQMVFIPAYDGGYVLVGAVQPCSPAFSAIDWGTAAVMRQTREQLAALGWQAGREWVELDPLPDLDEPADYGAALACGWLGADAAPDSGAARCVASP